MLFMREISMAGNIETVMARFIFRIYNQRESCLEIIQRNRWHNKREVPREDCSFLIDLQDEKRKKFKDVRRYTYLACTVRYSNRYVPYIYASTLLKCRVNMQIN
jgi:hypothetical protein